MKDSESLVPVLFSDSRYYTGMSSFSTKQTYLDLNANNITLPGIKLCLTDKQKVFLSEKDGNNFFQATDDGLKLSTGLNVILGERSTGKTFTLDKIAENFDNIKYIKQFSLLQNDIEKFNELVDRRNSSIYEEYLSDFKMVVNDVMRIDIKENERQINEYLGSLMKFASESEKQDVFSNCLLFRETLFDIQKQDGLKDLIDALTLLEVNVEYKDIIKKHISQGVLNSLKIDLMKEYVFREEINHKKKWVNELIANIKTELSIKTSSTTPAEVVFYDLLMDKRKITKFTNIVNSIKKPREIENTNIRDFKLVAKTDVFRSASQLSKK